jgi:RND family efflux transporter MFP subunit
MKIETHPFSDAASHAPAAAPTTRRPRSPNWRKPVAVLVVLGVAAGGWTVMRGNDSSSAPAPGGPVAQADGKKKQEVFELASGDIAAVEARSLAVSLPLSGSLAPLSSATIKSKVSGVVEATTVQEGMAVGAGQVLARIDQADLRARLQQQQAMLDEAQAKLAMATKNETNSEALLQQKYISQNAFDSTQNTVALARANVKSAAAMVEIARIALSDGIIKAPISGVVSKRHVQAGEKLSPDMPIYTIVNLSELTLEAQVPASEIPRVEVGQDVRFKVDGFQKREFEGKVARINPATEAGSRAMLVYIAVRNDDSALRAGMFAKGSIVTERSGVATIVPMTALRDDAGRQVVYKIEHGEVVAQPVTLGLRNDDEGYVEVTNGLDKGANVIVAKLDAVKPGAQVKLPSSASPANLASPAAASAASASAAKPAAPAQKG